MISRPAAFAASATAFNLVILHLIEGNSEHRLLPSGTITEPNLARMVTASWLSASLKFCGSAANSPDFMLPRSLSLNCLCGGRLTRGSGAGAGSARLNQLMIHAKKLFFGCWACATAGCGAAAGSALFSAAGALARAPPFATLFALL